MSAGLLISAPSSGTGKTTVMLGLLRALSEDGLKVQPFKSGPDYIDPAFHEAACGRRSFNLDNWAMGPDLWQAISARAKGADICIAEGSMGLYDGVATQGAQGFGSSAETALAMGWPVVLVLDVSGQAQSAAAAALGFRDYMPDLPFAGVILNRCASPRHERLTRLGMERAGLPVLGVLPRRGDLTLPERHLGLIQAVEHPELDQAIAGYAGFLRENVDLAAIRAAARGNALPENRALPARLRSASPLPVMLLSASSIRICSKAGVKRGRKSCPFRPSRMRHRTLPPISSGCPVAILNSMPGSSPLPEISALPCAAMRKRNRFMANAGAIWRSAKD